MYTQSKIPRVRNAAWRASNRLLADLIPDLHAQFQMLEAGKADANILLYGLLSTEHLRAFQTLIPEKAQLKVITDDEVEVASMSQLALSSYIDNVEVLLQGQDLPRGHFDVAFASFLSIRDPGLLTEHWSQINSHLVSGGQLIGREFNMRDFGCFPLSHGFDRFFDLIDRFVHTLPGQIGTGKQLKQRLLSLEYYDIQVTSKSPFFLSNSQKKEFGVILEYLGHHLVKNKIASEEEVVALLLELDVFLKTKHSLISFPAMFQFKATKI